MKISSSQKVIFTALAFSFVYAIIRYHVLRGVPWEHFPLFISNKAISLASVLLISLSYLLGPLSRYIPSFRKHLEIRKAVGLIGFGLAALHTLMSLILLNSANYSRFFTENRLNLTGELSLAAGVLALFVFTIVAVSSFIPVSGKKNTEKWLTIQRLGYWAMVAVLAHVVVMGWGGWFKPDTWPGGLIPISLVAAIAITSSILLKLVTLL